MSKKLMSFKPRQTVAKYNWKSYSFALGEAIFQNLESFHDNQASNDGIRGGYGWDDVASHSYNERHKMN